MTQAKSRFQTIDEYAALAPSDLPEGHFELVNGELIELPAESDLNVMIAGFLFSAFLQVVPHYLIRRGTEIFVNRRTVTSRYPDLMILSELGLAALHLPKRSAITFEMPSPLLVVEVVSPGTENYERDYIEKPREYALRGIPEYWLIDPERSVVIVLHLECDRYVEVGQFHDANLIRSPEFPELQLTAQQILRAGR